MASDTRNMADNANNPQGTAGNCGSDTSTTGKATLDKKFMAI